METIIGIKELHRTLPKVADAAERGESFMVVRHAKPVFRIDPVLAHKQPRYTLEDLKKISFKDKDKNLSKHIDKILYGV